MGGARSPTLNLRRRPLDPPRLSPRRPLPLSRARRSAVAAASAASAAACTVFASAVAESLPAPARLDSLYRPLRISSKPPSRTSLSLSLPLLLQLPTTLVLPACRAPRRRPGMRAPAVAVAAVALDCALW